MNLLRWQLLACARALLLCSVLLHAAHSGVAAQALHGKHHGHAHKANGHARDALATASIDLERQQVITAAVRHGLVPTADSSMHGPSNKAFITAGGNYSTTCNKYASVLDSMEWFTNASTRQDAQVYMGNQARLRMAFDRYLKGGNLSVTFIGGSITAGQGAVDAGSFPAWAKRMLHGILGPERVKVTNSAVPGTLSAYMSVCLNVHVPRDTDIVFVEYSVNDPETPQGPSMDNSVRRSYERLLRKILSFPNGPAVVMVHSFVWFRPPPYTGSFWSTSEREFHEFAMYYHLPELSVKAACWKLMRAGVPGYQVHRFRGNRHGGKEPPEVDAEMKGKLFYWDGVHPDGNTGHRIMGEMVVQALLDVMAGLQIRPISADDVQQALEPLPPPMLPNNFASLTDKCFIGSVFTETVIESNGYFYKDEGTHASRSKLGYISDVPGSELRLRVNTTSPTGNQGLAVTVTLAYLKSYVNMGRAAISCSTGCTCQETILDGHNEVDKTSQLNLHEFTASQSDACVLSIKVLEATTSGKNKVKIAGIMVSDEAAEGSLSNWAAVQMVHEAANQASNGVANFMMP